VVPDFTGFAIANLFEHAPNGCQVQKLVVAGDVFSSVSSIFHPDDWMSIFRKPNGFWS
jgi:hypothetical protein